MIKKKNFSEIDKKIWENYIKNPLDIYDKEKEDIKNYLNLEKKMVILYFLVFLQYPELDLMQQ